jgi:prepilin-type N-terminal cleavage/methylation domain-containing protein
MRLCSTGARATARRRRRAWRGFTLLEMLIVISVLAVVMGLGVGLIARLRVADRAALGVVANTIRSARNWAVAREASAIVRIDPGAGTIQALGFTVFGTWHFEELPLAGAFGQQGEVHGGELIADGFQGRALDFGASPANSGLSIAVQHDSAFEPARGFALACAVRLAGEAGGELLALGDSAGLAIADGGALEAWLAPEILQDDGTPRRGGRVTCTSGPGLIPPGRWTRVEAQYDRRALRLYVEGLEVARAEEDARVWRLEGPLDVSPGGTPFPGAVDALVVSIVTGEDVRELPKGVAFAADTPREIVFEPGGRLDRGVHAEPVRLALTLGDGSVERLLVNLHGTVE